MQPKDKDKNANTNNNALEQIITVATKLMDMMHTVSYDNSNKILSFSIISATHMKFNVTGAL